MKIKRVFIKVEGIVQGVGFRPFVYNLALSKGLNGWVNNDSEGVSIDIEGSEDNIEMFIFLTFMFLIILIIIILISEKFFVLPLKQKINEEIDVLKSKVK